MLFAYETDKASFEEFAPVDGTILSFLYESGDEVPVLKEVCVIGDAGETVASASVVAPASAVAPMAAEPVAEKKAVEAEVVSKSITQAGDSNFISPRAKILAMNEGVETSGMKGTGPNGRIIEQDILAYLASKPKLHPWPKRRQRKNSSARIALAAASVAQ